MPVHKVTFEFETALGATATAGNAGWSETWYDPADTTDDAAQTKAIWLKNQRRAILTQGWAITAIRLSQMDAAGFPTRKGRLIFVAPADAGGNYRINNQDEQPYDALILACASNLGYRRSFLLRGIPQVAVTPGGRYTAAAPTAEGLKTFIDALTGQTETYPDQPFAIRFRTKVTNIANPTGIFVIHNIIIEPAVVTGATPQTPFLELGDTTDLQVGMQVQVRNVGRMRGINHNWRVMKILAAAPPLTAGVLLAPKRRTTVSGTFDNSGQAKFFSYSFNGIDVVTPGHGTSRRTGRPLGLSRGRRSATFD